MIAAMLLALAVAQATEAAPPAEVLPPGSTTVLQGPTAREIADHYPRRMARRMQSGVGEAVWTVADSGWLEACTPVAEYPVDSGSAAAAARITPKIRVAPLTKDGRPTAGARVRMPVVFRVF